MGCLSWTTVKTDIPSLSEPNVRCTTLMSCGFISQALPIFSYNVEKLGVARKRGYLWSGFSLTSFSVAKKIAPSGTRQDLDLDNEYFVLYGRRMGDSGVGFLTKHELGANNPEISSMVNPVTAGGAAAGFPKPLLIRLHGILMIIAWPLLANCGIFFASWMRPALPKGQWFQVLSLCMLTAAVLDINVIIIFFIMLGSSCVHVDFNVHRSSWFCSCFHCQLSFWATKLQCKIDC